MTAPDIFALGGRQDDDAEILALFRQWCAACHACRQISETATDEEFEAADHVSNSLAEQFYDTPVQGAVGLAIKAFMVGTVAESLDDDLVDPCALGPFDENSYACRTVFGTQADVAHLYMGSHALRGLLSSVGAFVPELQALVAKAVASPLTLPLDDDGADVEGTVH